MVCFGWLFLLFSDEEGEDYGEKDTNWNNASLKQSEK